VIVRLAWPSLSDTTFTGTPSARSSVAPVAKVVQSNERQPLSAQGLPGAMHMRGEPAGEPFEVPVVALETAQHESGVANEIRVGARAAR
jgi:hypothetical protein